MGTFQCRTTKKCAPRQPHASRSPSRAAFPPASTSRPFFCLSASTSRLLCAKPTAPTHLDEDATHGTHVPAKKLAVITADTETIISRASGAGRLAWFGFGFRVAGSVQLACQKARGIYGALVTSQNWTVVAACLRSFRRALTAVHPEPARGPNLVTSATQLKIGEP